MRRSRSSFPRAVAAAELLADARCDIIVFHCTGSSMHDGLEAEREVIDAIQKATGRLATSTASALLAALEAMDARKVVLTAPSTEEGLESETRFVESAGYEVVHGRAVGLPGSDGFVAEPSETWVQVAIEEQDPRADLMLMACTNLHTTEVIQEMEAAIGRPVLTSNQSTLWYCLRRLGRNDDIPELGQLFKLPLKDGARRLAPRSQRWSARRQRPDRLRPLYRPLLGRSLALAATSSTRWWVMLA